MYSNDEVSDLVQYDAEFYREVFDVRGCLAQLTVRRYMNQSDY